MNPVRRRWVGLLPLLGATKWCQPGRGLCWPPRPRQTRRPPSFSQSLPPHTTTTLTSIIQVSYRPATLGGIQITAQSRIRLHVKKNALYLEHWFKSWKISRSVWDVCFPSPPIFGSTGHSSECWLYSNKTSILCPAFTLARVETCTEFCINMARTLCKDSSRILDCFPGLKLILLHILYKKMSVIRYP